MKALSEDVKQVQGEIMTQTNFIPGCGKMMRFLTFSCDKEER